MLSPVIAPRNGSAPAANFLRTVAVPRSFTAVPLPRPSQPRGTGRARSPTMRTLVALGGNAFAGPQGTVTGVEQLLFASRVVGALEPLWAGNRELLLTHGNGPQVGAALLRSELARAQASPLTLSECVAQTQAELGHVLSRAWSERVGSRRPLVTVLTHVEVDPDDPAFAQPTKPIGPWLDAEHAAELSRAGQLLREEPGRGFRRVVPSPLPLRVFEQDAIRQLLAQKWVVVAAGGGGIPVVASASGWSTVEGVVDKDLTSALLASELGLEQLILLTDVPCAYTDFRTATQEPLSHLRPVQARRLLAQGHFPPGSMGPKVEAALRFVLPGRRALICNPETLPAALLGKGGTLFTAD